MKSGKLIVMEGACDGIGKSTQLHLLKEHLEKDGQRIASHHFPSYGTYHGKLVEEYLSGSFGSPKDTSPYFINSLYAVDRAIAWKLFLKEAYERGDTVLLDRYTTSSIIYQSSVIEDIEERKKFIDYICDFEYDKLGIQKPDSVIFLHAPFEVVRKTREARKVNDGIENDIHERDLEYMKGVYDNAMMVADYLGWDMIDCSRDGKMKSIEEIHEHVYQKVK